MKVAIVGAGIAGLSAAFDLHRAGVEVSLFEASGRFGGKIWSSPVGDRLVDAGPDTFLARVPHGRQLCEDLGLADELTSPIAPVPAYLCRDGELHPLPASTVLGVPTDLEALADSGVISPDGIERAAQDLELPTTTIGDDISVGSYFRARLGDEVTDRLIDPILGGINASDIDRLSLRAGAPQLWRAATENRSIIEGLRALRKEMGPTLGSAGSDEPVFYGLPGGVARIVDALVVALDGADLWLDSPVESLAQLGAAVGDVDHIILAVPAPVAGRLVADVSPDAAELLGQIDFASVAQVTIEVPKRAVDPELDAAGILFPPIEGLIATASTWFSTKWAHYQRPDTVLIRLTSGRFGDTRALAFDDEGLCRALLTDLKRVVKIDGEPTATRVVRWLEAFPQYVPGHLAWTESIFEALEEDAPTVHLTGASYHGIGLPACIENGRSLAAELIG